MLSYPLTAARKQLVMRRASFVQLVGRGKTGLGLEEETECSIAFGGAATMAGGGPVSSRTVE